MSFIDRDAKHDGYEVASVSESESLIVGLDERSRRKRFRRRICVWLFAAIALIFAGHAVFTGVFAYKYAKSHVECVPYEGGTTVVKLPVLHPRAAVLVDASISSNDVTVTHVETDSNEITFTIEQDTEALEEDAELRLCTLKGRKLTGLGIFAGKKGKHENFALPVIKSLKIEVPTSISAPSISLLPPKHGCSKAAKLFQWAGVWNSHHAGAEKLRSAGTSE